ncbi:MAG: hypothetical protein KAG28_09090 [Cocleimonas sp.]|nr:hypothetical protein [Cocleimonas sp.]
MNAINATIQAPASAIADQGKAKVLGSSAQAAIPNFQAIAQETASPIKNQVQEQVQNQIQKLVKKLEGNGDRSQSADNALSSLKSFAKGQDGIGFAPNGGPQNKVVVDGNNQDDFIIGDNNPWYAGDFLDGKGGDDIILGLSGNDYIKGGWGDDILFGGSGNDTLDGGYGDDVLYGGSGHDIIDTGKGANTVFGGSGHDNIRSHLGSSQTFGNNVVNTIDGGSGYDTVQYEGSASDYNISTLQSGQKVVEYVGSNPSDYGKKDILTNVENIVFS